MVLRSLLDTATVTISVTGLDLLALDKLTLVSYALADKIGGRAGDEQKALAETLAALCRQIKLKAANA